MLVQPGAVLCYTRKLFEILIERWQQRGQGWLSTIATKFIKNIFWWEIHHEKNNQRG